MRISYISSTVTDPKGLYVITKPAFRVSGGDPQIAAKARERLEASAQTESTRFVAAATEAGKESTPYTLRESVTDHQQWGQLYSVRMTAEVDLHGAHGVANSLAVTVDLRTGNQIAPQEIFVSPSAADAVVRKTFVARGHLGAVTPERITIGATSPTHDLHVASYPTPAGLVIASSQCAPEDCVTGPLVVVLPWRSLPATRAGVLPA